MSDTDDEVLQLFLEESREHLEDIESDLLTIEEQGENVDPELVNQVFRAIHTIKGAAGFFGLDNIKELSHVMEHLLDQIRKRVIVPEPAVVSVLLDGSDVLTKMIHNPDTSNDVDITDLLSQLRESLNRAMPEKEQKSLDERIPIKWPGEDRVLFQVSALDIDNALKANKGGTHIYLIQYDLYRDIEQKGKNPMHVISELQQLSYFIDSTLDIEAAGTLDDDEGLKLPFYAFLSTVLEPDLMSHFLELDSSQVHDFTPDEIKALRGPTTEDSQPAEAQAAPAPAETPKADPPQEKAAATPTPEPAKPAAAAPPTPKAAAPEPKKAAAKPAADTSQTEKRAPTKKPEASLRVHVGLIDRLMNLAGELVLTRNELMQASQSGDAESINKATSKVDHITSELQEAIMSTRMQSIGIVFNKFQRVVRDISKQLGKQIRIDIDGEDVELDKTIIEAIGDPLTHLVRNACDHGIEMPDKRRQSGKNEEGHLQLRALHEAGQVVIEIRDDGAGINRERVKEKAQNMGLVKPEELARMSDREINMLILAPGFSTAAQVTDISGRGVGMDVVATNIGRLGGTMDIESTPGKGSIFRIKLPLTLAIIPSLLLSVDSERYAIPQVNLQELVRIPAAEVKRRIERIGAADVMRLRGDLLPLVRLSEVLGIRKFFIDPNTGEKKLDRRFRIADRRSLRKDEDGKVVKEKIEISSERDGDDRRRAVESAMNIAVVTAGNIRYGLIVDELMDSAEIVVKPLGYHLTDCQIYAGATILGDGTVASILDVEGISRHSELSSLVGGRLYQSNEIEDEAIVKKDEESLLLVQNTPEDIFAIPLGLVVRIETVESSQIERTGGRIAIKYRGGSLALFNVEEVANVAPRPDSERFNVVVFKVAGREVGLAVAQILDIVETDITLDTVTHAQPGIFGSAIINERITLFLDLYGMVAKLMPQWVQDFNEEVSLDKNCKVLVVEDSPFFLNQVSSFMEDAGYSVLKARDGVEALKCLEQNQVDLVLTDIEMPNMDGFELTRQLRENDAFAHLPVIAITSLSGTSAREKGTRVGMDAYLVKLDREEILEQAKTFLERGRS